MRVGLITSEFPPDLGGVETYSWQLARELGRRNDLEVTVYAPPASAGIVMPDRVALKPIVTSCAGLDWAKLKKEPIDVWHALSAAHSWIALRDRPTVVSVHGNDFLTPYPLTARPALNLPLLWRWRSWAWRAFEPRWQEATRRMLARSLPRCGTIIANSRYTAATLARMWPDCAARSRVGWVGVDPTFFDVARTPRTGPPTLLTVARLSEPRKNVDLVLRALATLKDRFAFQYVVTGDGTERSRLVQLAASLGLAPRVRFTGRVSTSDLHDLYSNADLFVLTASIVPGSHEGFGIVYLEAAAAGVPSLAARLAGAAEAVGDGESGYFVEQPDVESVSKALARFLSGDARFDPVRCRSFARRFGWSNVADLAEQSYRLASVPNFRP